MRAQEWGGKEGENSFAGIIAWQRYLGSSGKGFRMYRFTSAHIIKAQNVLRHAAGMWEETFDERQFIAALRAEILALRAGGRTWVEISDLLRIKAHIEIDPETLAALSPEPRRKKRIFRS